ncbi:MAG: hypothetical protein JNN15_10875 [Blastocatellia bacterium]|nr:hypothetical protein [Blastocatellia bacterium]
MESKIVIEESLTNRDFLERYASAGCVGLVGATHLIDIGIKKAQRVIRADRKDGQWTHAFLFEGCRIDGYHWILESDLDIAKRHFRFGVQENRITKYFDEKEYPTIAVLDFGLTQQQIQTVITTALDLLAEQWKYSIRELFGTLVALPSRRLSRRPNLLQRERSLYCSAFVQYVFMKVGLDFAPDIDEKNTAPEHIISTKIPHTAYILKRDINLILK